jgi:general secretion pathway protein K
MRKFNPNRADVVAQRGAALLAAMLTVALVAAFASTALWQQWGSIEVERAERQRLQVAWMLTGALDWSRLILREDSRTGNVDHLGEPWALVLEESRLSTFLAADKSNTGGIAIEDTLDAFLSGQVQDAQSQMNITSLLDGGNISPTQKASFTKLFSALGLPQAELNTLCDQLLLASRSTSGSPDSARAPLMPQRFRQLAWLGVSESTLQRLEPFVTVLPKSSSVNLNTAPVDVLYASIPKADRAMAALAAQSRTSKPFQNLDAAALALGLQKEDLDPRQHSVGSQYFFVLGRMRLEEITIQEVSLIERIGRSATTLWRERGVLPPATSSPLQ